MNCAIRTRYAILPLSSSSRGRQGGEIVSSRTGSPTRDVSAVLYRLSRGRKTDAFRLNVSDPERRSRYGQVDPAERECLLALGEERRRQKARARTATEG